MIAGYELPDVYQSVAEQLGVSRKIAKVAMLAIQYGAGPRRLERSGIPRADAERIFQFHKDTYSTYWGWSDSCLDTLKTTGIHRLGGDGWALRLGGDEDNLLSARNFPIQGTAAAILRQVVLDTSKEGIEIIAPLHDAVLIQAPLDQAQAYAERMRETMRKASERFLRSAVRVAAHIYRDRFEDKDGAEDWGRISELLKGY
jgi:DNA polymerase-1